MTQETYDLSKHTAQEIVDIVCEGLASQDFKKSGSGNGSCLYNTPVEDGKILHCAAGHVLAKFGIEISALQNSVSWPSLVKDRVVTNDHAVLISVLQDCHDNSQTKKDMKRRLVNAIRLRYALEVPKVLVD